MLRVFRSHAHVPGPSWRRSSGAHLGLHFPGDAQAQRPVRADLYEPSFFSSWFLGKTWAPCYWQPCKGLFMHVHAFYFACGSLW